MWWCRLLLLLCVPFGAAVATGITAGDGLPLPPLRWQDGEGERHQLRGGVDKPKVLHFWAAWCGPCRKEMPEVLAWKRANPDVELLPLSLDRRMAQASHFVRKNGLDMPVLLVDEDDAEALAIPVLPYTLFVSADGRLLGHYPGMAPWLDGAFSAEVRALLGLPTQAP